MIARKNFLIFIKIALAAFLILGSIILLILGAALPTTTKYPDRALRALSSVGYTNIRLNGSEDWQPCPWGWGENIIFVALYKNGRTHQGIVCLPDTNNQNPLIKVYRTFITAKGTKK